MLRRAACRPQDNLGKLADFYRDLDRLASGKSVLSANFEVIDILRGHIVVAREGSSRLRNFTRAHLDYPRGNMTIPAGRAV